MKLKKIKKLPVILLLGLGHGLNDLTAGFFLGSLVLMKADILQISMGLFLYNLLAFGGQYPVAIFIEKKRSLKQFLLLSYGLNIFAIVSFSFMPQLSIVLAGIGSAIYHVAGGTVCAEKNKAVNIGIFAAPGVAGLITGGYLAYAGINILPALLIASTVFFILLTMLPFKIIYEKDNEFAENKKNPLDQHDIIMILLLTIISLRSVIWNVFQLMYENNYHWLIAIAIAAFIGKIAGGWLADKIGWRLYLMISLAVATPLVTFFRKELLLFSIGVGLLQSGIPASTSLLIHAMRGRIQRAIGLSFGTAIIGGAIIFYTPARSFLLSNTALCSITVIILVLLFFVRKNKTGVSVLDNNN